MKKTLLMKSREKATDKIKYSILVFFCLTFCVLLTVYAPQSKNGISQALEICSKTVIPSLFPFMFLSSFMSESGIFNKNFKVADKITKAVFNLPQTAFAVFIMSGLGGFPVGGKMTKQLYERGYLTQNQAQRLLLFSVNPGPAFTFSVIGLSLFGNIKIGYIVYASILISNFIIALLSRFISDSDTVGSMNNERHELYTAFVRSGSNAATSMVSICTFVLIFSCLESVLSGLIDNETVIDVLSGTLEVTTGCERLARFSSVPLIAGITAWGGVSVHCQIADCIKKTGLDLKLFLTARLLSAGMSSVICDFLFKIFPTEIYALAANANVTSVMSETSFPISVAMLLTCCVFLIGDYSFNSKRKC